jgi:hypothetical protein
LNHIGSWAFGFCRLLESIVVPSSVKTIGQDCFDGCGKLETWPLRPDSEVVRIEDSAFGRCSSLKSAFLPSTVEFIGDDCFLYSYSLSSLTFGPSSHLRELLDLPFGLSGFVSIPDSVEILSLGQHSRRSWWRRKSLALSFGSDSRLTAIQGESGRFFLQVSTRSLKIFRRNKEFERTDTKSAAT